MKPSDFQKTIQCQFDCKLKKVVKGIVRNYRKELARRQAKEVSFCELPEIVEHIEERRVRLERRLEKQNPDAVKRLKHWKDEEF